jgi:formylglycine-generating enzyme required for sulfatase activity
MITRPAELAGLRFEKGLSGRILDDTGMEPGALALMAFALYELWQKSKGAEGILTHAAYRSFNGVYGAIGKRAEDTFRELARKKIVSEADLALVFRELVEVDERRKPTRRREQQSQVGGGAAAETVVNALIDARLLVTSKGEDQRPMVEVAHEAIFTNWPRLSRWIDDHADELRACRSLARAAQDWKEDGAPSFSHLPDRATLKQYRRVRPACSLGENTEVVGRFLGAARRRQWLWGGFLAMFVLVVSIGSVDIWLRERNWNVLRIWALAQVGLYDGPPMVEIPGGTFQMGSPDSDSDADTIEFPQHRVTIKSFLMGKFEVTSDEYEAFVLDTDDVELPHDENWGRGSRPVIYVSWNDSKAYIGWLSKVTGKKYRLPTDAEWEHAARAGTETAFSFGDDSNKLGEYAWYRDNSEGQTHPVGKKKPNAWDLFDMHGNVWEWVEDDWHDNYNGAPHDGRAWVDDPRGAARVVRGGGWDNDARYCRSAFRYDRVPGNFKNRVGFRLSRSVALDPLDP